jgi:hypothetical protein
LNILWRIKKQKKMQLRSKWIFISCSWQNYEKVGEKKFKLIFLVFFYIWINVPFFPTLDFSLSYVESKFPITSIRRELKHNSLN